MFFGPFQDRVAGELGAVVRDDADRLAVEAHHRIQLARDAGAGDAGISNQADVLAAAVVVDGQDAEPARGPERVRHEVHGPPLVRAQSLRHRRPAASSTLAASSAAHRAGHQDALGCKTTTALSLRRHLRLRERYLNSRERIPCYTKRRSLSRTIHMLKIMNNCKCLERPRASGTCEQQECLSCYIISGPDWPMRWLVDNTLQLRGQAILDRTGFAGG